MYCLLSAKWPLLEDSAGLLHDADGLELLTVDDGTRRVCRSTTSRPLHDCLHQTSQSQSEERRILFQHIFYYFSHFDCRGASKIFLIVARWCIDDDDNDEKNTKWISLPLTISISGCVVVVRFSRDV